MVDRVLVGCPTYEGKAYCLQDYAAGVHSLTYPAKELLLVDNSATDRYLEELRKHGLPAIRLVEGKSAVERVIACRNLLRHKTLEGGFTHFLSLEQDVIPPADVIERLLMHQKPVMTALYYKRFKIRFMHQGKEHTREEIRPVLYRSIPDLKDKMHFCTAQEVEAPRVFPVKVAGLGCMLIHRDVLEKISFRHEEGVWDDVTFCLDLEKNGIPLFVDTSQKCRHLLQKTS